MASTRLALIQGGKRSEGSSGTTATASSGLQLSLPGLAPSRAAIVSLGYHDLPFSRFEEVLARHDVRRIVDIRVSASFSGNGFDPERVFRFFEGRKIRYFRFPALGNRFIGDHLNPQVVLHWYREHLSQCTAELAALFKLVRDGPALLLGPSERHEGSEREALVEALSEVDSDFSLAIEDPLQRAREE